MEKELISLEEEIKDQEKEYYARLEKEIKNDNNGKKPFIDKKAINEICCFKAVKKLDELSKARNDI